MLCIDREVQPSPFITARKRSCGKVMFLQVSVILSTEGGMRGCGGHGWQGRGRVWLQGGMHGCGAVHGCGGACVVAGGHAWLQGGHAWLLGGA